MAAGGPVVIRLARAADADAVRQVVQAAYRPYVVRMGKPPGPMLDDYAQRIADAQVWVLEDDGIVVGVLVLEDGRTGLLLDNLAVSPDAQGRGHGRRLLAFAEHEARRRGHAEVQLYTNVVMTENVALYARHGYRETGAVTQDGYNRITMAKPVTGPPTLS